MRKRYIIGIDLGATNLKIALLDTNCRIKEKVALPTRKFIRKTALISAIIRAVHKIMHSIKCRRHNILGIGIGVPGPVDFPKGMAHSFTNIPGWKKVGLRAILQRKLGIPVFIDNDANLMALAEARRGAARGALNAVCLTLGTGVGGGLIIDKRLYRGSTFGAGEIGHMPINEKGPACKCGGMACLEAYVGNKRISTLARRLFGRRITPEKLAQMSRQGNLKARRIWLEVGRHLGVALCAVVNLLNPEVIVIGGGVAGAGGVLFDAAKRLIRKRAMPVQAKAVRVVRAKLGNDAGIVGAALLVKENLGNRLK
jgi:glucokinase